MTTMNNNSWTGAGDHNDTDLLANGTSLFLNGSSSSSLSSLFFTTNEPSTTIMTTPAPEPFQFEMDVQHYAAEKGDPTIAWTCSLFLGAMILFSVVKTVSSNGIGVFDLRVTGISFPQRPEILVLLCSTIPTMISVIARPIIPKYAPIVRDFVIGWGACQARVFFDLFTRTASLTHMMYWNNRLVIIRGLFYIYQKWKERRQRSGADIGIPLQLPEFSRLCKRLIPAVIYVISAILTAPSCFLVPSSKLMNRNWTIYNTSSHDFNFYAHYDHIGLIGVPIVVNIIQFYYLALQADSKWKMPYRLRCYLVTFILMNIPLFVTLACLPTFKASATKQTLEERMANAIILSMTCYHACFAIKPVVYTTGCNCICCGPDYLKRHPRLERVVVFWSTPQHKKKKDWEARHKIHKQEEQQLANQAGNEETTAEDILQSRMQY